MTEDRNTIVTKFFRQFPIRNLIRKIHVNEPNHMNKCESQLYYVASS
jgi:hypothetical protein